MLAPVVGQGRVSWPDKTVIRAFPHSASFVSAAAVPAQCRKGCAYDEQDREND
jgi:hypothetical protein